MNAQRVPLHHARQGRRRVVGRQKCQMRRSTSLTVCSTARVTHLFERCSIVRAPL